MKKVFGLCIALSAGLMAQTAETVAFRAILSPANEVPAVTGIAATGVGTVYLHVVRDTAGKVVSATTDFVGTYQLPGEVTFTGMHIHKGTAAEAGPVTINSGLSAANSVADPTGRGSITGQGFTLPADTAGLDTVNGMLTNPAGFYFNMHTTVNPGGVLRGQLQRADMVVLMGLMNAKNEVPAVDSTATGVASVIALVTRDSNGAITSGLVTFDVNYTGFSDPTTFTGFHIHQGNSTVAGPVTINTGINATTASVPAASGGSGNLHFDVELATASAAAVATMETLFANSENAYINLHTTVFPGGVIRAQLRRTDKLSFPVVLQTANEVPAITGLDASAPSAGTVYTIRNADGTVAAATVIFDVNYRFPGAVTFTGLHIHDGKAGTNGSVTINTGLNATNNVVSTTGFGNIYKVVNVAGAAALSTANSLAQNPENHYMNLHSVVSPGGVVRSQLKADNTKSPVLTAAILAISDSTRTTVAPSSLMTIFGTDLIKVSSDVQASSTGGVFPVNYNGTSVTVGGKNAPLVVVAPGYLVVQVPSDVPAGSQDLIVKNSNGVSATSKITVATYAPGIFFDGNGGVILKNSNYSLVGSSNAAKAGDVVLIYTTGLGTITGLSSGQLVPAPTGTADFFRTAPVTVTVGGKDAPVIYSLASPGYVGLYQTAVTIPSGAGTGNVPVVLKIGTATSNTVNVFLQ